MEIHPTWIIVLGLGFDIAGAILIIKPLLNYVDRRTHKYKGKKLVDYEPKQFVTDDYKKEWGKQTLARIGLGLLVTGFTLQIIGNWYQNQPV